MTVGALTRRGGRPGASWVDAAETLLAGRGYAAVRVAVDAAMLLAALAGALADARSAGDPAAYGFEVYLIPVLTLVILQLRGVYRRRLRLLLLDDVGPLFVAVSLASVAALALATLVHPGVTPTGVVLRVWLASLLYAGCGQLLLGMTQRLARSRGRGLTPTLIVGAGEIGAKVAHRLAQNPQYGLRPTGFLDAHPPPTFNLVDRPAPLLGPPELLAEAVRDTGAGHVMVAFSAEPDHGLVHIVRRCDELGVEVSLVPRLFESLNDRVSLGFVGGLPLLELNAVDPKGWQFAVKHAVDRLVAAVALLALSPLLAAVAVAIKLGSPGPVFFRQRRVGRDGREFDVLKFRSMSSAPAGVENDADWAVQVLGGEASEGPAVEDRRTTVGRMLRRSSLDELPQLINVLKGEMSLIGPRPERVGYVRQFEGSVYRYDDRHRVQSGITGWAQVNGLRGKTSLADRVEWDNYYIENWSLELDIKIVLLTLFAVLRPVQDD